MFFHRMFFFLTQLGEITDFPKRDNAELLYVKKNTEN